ncbi:MAG: T9SS type A sorting domain-containing protein [Saprospiraceae bacterium]|nr:T9SS type A sorting domain-containing protein [Saprospiraceae bacterium]
MNETPYCLSQGVGIDHKGNGYISTFMHEGVYQFSFETPSLQVNKLPKISPFVFKTTPQTVISLFVDPSDQVYAIRESIPYIYRNGIFTIDSLLPPNNLKLPVAYENTKMDNEGELFFSFGDIYKYREKWNKRNLIKVFIQNLVFDYFPYDYNNNYAITNISDDNNGTRVYHYNSEDLKYKKIIETNQTIFRKTSYISPSGHVYLPSTKGLLHYWDEGEKIEIPILDSISGAHIPTMGAFGCKQNDCVLVRNSSGFYSTNDNGVSWTKPKSINLNFPEGEIINLELYDSIRAIVTIKESCELAPRPFVITKETGGWTPLDIGESYMELRNLIEDKNGRLFAFMNQCQWAVSIDKGKNWDGILLNKLPLPSLIINEENELLGFEYGKDSILYKSNDLGKNWIPIYTFKGRLLFVHNLTRNRMMAITDITWFSPNPSYHYYYSEDGGKNWILQYEGNNPSVPIGRMVMDPNGKLLAWDRTVLLSSTNKGKVWQIDPQYSRMKNLESIYFDEDGKTIVSGYLDGKFGLYQTSDFINFDNLLIQIPSNPFYLEYLGEGKMAAFGGNKSNYLFFSFDYGQSWTDILNDLPIDQTLREIEITDFFIDKQNHLYLTNFYDGVYRTFHPLTSTQDIQKDKLISIYPNPASDQLTVSLKEAFSNFPVRLVIQNMLGQTVLEMKLLSSHNNVNLNQLPAGIYAVVIYHQDTLKHREMMMKK